jgi:uncharacterized membrane protein
MGINGLTLQHAWWVPVTIFYYIVYSWLSKYQNDHALDGDVWYKQFQFWLMFAWGALCPLWLVISRISKNITFDGMLYDNIMFLTFVGTMAVMGAGSKFEAHQWIGVALIVFGSILMRVELQG